VLVAPTLLHGGVGVYGACLLAMAVALYTDPAPAVAEKVGDVRLERA
jgi:hypothetical protein